MAATDAEHPVGVEAEVAEDPTAALWTATTTEPWNFDAWMALISALEKLGEPARPHLKTAYDSFLSEFPLCYGYWDKLAKLEKIGEGGVGAALAVYARGVQVIFPAAGFLSPAEEPPVRVASFARARGIWLLQLLRVTEWSRSAWPDEDPLPCA